MLSQLDQSGMPDKLINLLSAAVIIIKEVKNTHRVSARVSFCKPVSKKEKMSYEITFVQRLHWFVNAIFHQALTVIVVYIIWTIAQIGILNYEMRWHVILTTLGVSSS